MNTNFINGSLINAGNNNFNMNNNFNNNIRDSWDINDLSNKFSNLNLNNNGNIPLNRNNTNNNFPPINNCLMNNMVNMGNMNGFNMCPADKNPEITMKFCFMAAQMFRVKGKLDQKLSTIIERFKNGECPGQLKEHMKIPIHAGLKINPEKTLSDIGIKDGEIILFVMDTKNKEVKKIVKKKKKEEDKLTEDEVKQIKKWLAEYEAMKYMRHLIKDIFKVTNDNNDDNNLIPLDSRESMKFIDFVREKEKCGFINVKEHNHKLVYCLTNFKWKCDLCKKANDKNNARYYCSICNFNMCDKCHLKGNYTKKKVFPDGVKPSNECVKEKFINTAYHEHRLVYCRSSRSVIGYNGWICDNCRDNFDNEVWSFFCTSCDFDLCCSCVGYH
jgi:hypothetical protein